MKKIFDKDNFENKSIKKKVWKHCSKKKSCGEILYQSTMFFFKKKTIKLNYQPAQYEKKKKLKLTKTILKKKQRKNKKAIWKNTVAINSVLKKKLQN